MSDQSRNSGLRMCAVQTTGTAEVTLHEADLEALLGVIRARDPGELQRRSARLRALLGPSADRLEPHLQALRAQMHALQHAQHLAATDALTGLANRRTFGEALRRELARSQRNGTPLSVVMLDLDDFKRINDTLGHATGDQVLRLLARCAREHTRQGDLAARLGGDEIALLLPDTEATAARAIGWRIRKSLARTRPSHGMAASIAPIGVSCGVGVSRPGSSVPSVLADADRDLYRAKTARKSVRPSAA